MRGTKKDYYEILGVPRNATKEQIDAAFAKLAMKWHPDRVPPEKKEEAERKFKEISEAYSVLSDPEKRRLYDMGMDPEGGVPGGGAAYDFMHMDLEEILRNVFGEGFGFGDFGFGDFFENVFGRRRGREPRERPEDLDIHLEVELSVPEMVMGTTRRVRYRRKVRCHRCGGEGILNPRTCQVCGGTGRVRQHRRSFFGVMVVERPCPNCGGTGISGETCPVCGGSGYEVEEVEREVTIPAGVLPGQKVVYRNAGHVGRSGTGRLVLHVKERPDPRYERKGRDVVLTVDLSPARAVLGGEVEITDPRGERVKVRVPQGVQYGEVFARLKGRGIPDPKGGKGGDLLVKARIKVPTKLSREQRKLYERLLEIEEQP